MFEIDQSDFSQCLDKIRFYSTTITNSGSVKFNKKNLDSLIDMINTTDYGHNIIVYDKQKTLQEKIALIIIFSAINYCYTDPKSKIEYSYRYNNKEYSRSGAFIKALLSADINWSNDSMVQKISEKKWRSILQLTDKNIIFDHKNRLKKVKIASRYIKVNNLLRIFDRPFREGDLFTSLLNSNLFDDIFLKRTQVAISLIRRLASHYNIKCMREVKLTAMADYRLPQVLYNFNIIVLNKSLKEKIIERHILQKNETEEILLRAWTIVICKYIADKTGLSEEKIDNAIWNISQEMLKKNQLKIPAMLVETDCY